MSSNSGKEQKIDEVENLTDKVNKIEISEPVLRGVTGEVKWFSCYNGKLLLKL